MYQSLKDANINFVLANNISRIGLERAYESSTLCQVRTTLNMVRNNWN